MPILGFLDIAIAIFFAVHAVRSGRNTITRKIQELGLED